MLPRFGWFGLNTIISGRRSELCSGQNIEQLDNLT